MRARWAMGLLILTLFPFPLRSRADDYTIPVQLPGGIVILAEIADTPKKRAEGLMFRDHLPKDRGMLFTFGQAQPWTFWMKNTKIPLDIIWMNDKKQVIHIAHKVPICTRTDDSCPQYQPNDPALYVLELGSGEAERLKIEKGSKIQFRAP